MVPAAPELDGSASGLDETETISPSGAPPAERAGAGEAGTGRDSPSEAIHPVTTRTPHSSGRRGGKNTKSSFAAPVFRPGCNGVHQLDRLFQPVDDPALGLVIGRELDSHPVARQHTDVMEAHAAGEVGQHLPPII